MLSVCIAFFKHNISHLNSLIIVSFKMKQINMLETMVTLPFQKMITLLVDVLDTMITLSEGKENDINGWAIVVHASVDNLGLGGNPES